jgi:hypothetical protein
MRRDEPEGTAPGTAARLDEHDADEGADGTKSLIGALAAGLQVAYDRMGESGERDSAAIG